MHHALPLRRRPRPALFVGLAAAVLAATAATAPADPAEPSGRPPVGPLERVDGKRLGFRLEVRIREDPRRVNRVLTPGSLPSPVDPGSGHPLRVDSGPIVVPLALDGTFHEIRHDALAPRLWIAGRSIDLAPAATRLERGHRFGQHHAVIELVDVQQLERTNDVRFTIEGETAAWSSRLDDDAAARIGWPREWPADVAGALEPQPGIESDDAVFVETVERVTAGNPRSLPPFLAAKELVRFCLANVRVQSDFDIRGEAGTTSGYDVCGAKAAAETGLGSRTDVVLVCIATLRAAGIPARPVFGISEDRDDPRARPRLVAWGEFWLPDAGWVPFDPDAMRSYSVANLPRDRPWPSFGTMKDLNERVTLSHELHPAGHEIADRPALWGWRPEPSGPDHPINDVGLEIRRLGALR